MSSMWQDYSTYLKTEAWKDLRRQVIKRECGKCQRCGCKKRTMHVHHLTYVRFGREALEDLMLVCEPCHMILHDRVKRKKRRKSRAQREATRKARYAKQYRPWLPEDRARMRKMGVPIPAPYTDLD